MPRKRTGGVRRSEKQWTEILRRFASSGVTTRSFCQREGLPLSSFQRWQRRLGSLSPAKFVEIVPAKAATTAPASWSAEVSLPNGTILRFQA